MRKFGIGLALAGALALSACANSGGFDPISADNNQMTAGMSETTVQLRSCPVSSVSRITGRESKTEEFRVHMECKGERSVTIVATGQGFQGISAQKARALLGQETIKQIRKMSPEAADVLKSLIESSKPAI